MRNSNWYFDREGDGGNTVNWSAKERTENVWLSVNCSVAVQTKFVDIKTNKTETYTVCFNSFGTLYDGITLEVIEII